MPSLLYPRMLEPPQWRKHKMLAVLSKSARKRRAMVGVQANKRCYFGRGPGGRSHSLFCERASHCLALLSNHSRLISSAWTSLLRRRASWAERSSREPICLKWHRCCCIALLPIEGSGTQLAFSSHMKATVLDLSCSGSSQESESCLSPAAETFGRGRKIMHANYGLQFGIHGSAKMRAAARAGSY
jgi:hypothetical protein